MKCSLAFLVMLTQVLSAGLERYSDLVVADALPAAHVGRDVRVTYLGTNGFEFESSNHVLLVDPYFSRINLWQVVLGSPIQPDQHRIADALTRGAGESKANHAQDAVTAGREILLAVDALNRDLAARSREPLQIGIGIHSGPAIVGSICSPQRLEFTAIGNAVNIASRIESLTKTVGRPMLITEAVRDRLRDQSGLEELPLTANTRCSRCSVSFRSAKQSLINYECPAFW